MDIDKDKVIDTLNRILELELAGVVRYTHYAMMVFGHSRIPIIGWLQKGAQQSLTHAQRAGEMITLLGGHPSLGIGPLLETHKHGINDILREALETENSARKAYYDLLELVQGKSVLLEEYARELISEEELDADEVNKMLRHPGDVKPYKM